MSNHSYIDLFITTSPDSFRSTSTLCTGLSDFHKLIEKKKKNFHKLVLAVLRTSFRKKKN